MAIIGMRNCLFVATALAALGLSQAHAGIVTFNVANNDAASGISAAKTYTTKSNMGSNSVVVNGVTFDSIVRVGTTITSPGMSAVATGGVFPEWKSDAQNIGFPGGTNIAEGDFKTLVTQFRYTPTSSTDSQVYTLFDLIPGYTYDLRIYGRLWVSGARNVDLVFTGDGATTNYSFNEDGTADGWYISHVFTYDGVSTPGFTATSNFHSYGFSNEVVSAIPEPASLGLLGVAGLLVIRRRQA